MSTVATVQLVRAALTILVELGISAQKVSQLQQMAKLQGRNSLTDEEIASLITDAQSAIDKARNED